MGAHNPQEISAFRVLGRTLKPFTLGHQFLLSELDSCFAIGSRNPFEFSDLLISVFVCSMPHDEAIRKINEGKLIKAAKRWGIKLAIISKFVVVDFCVAKSLFQSYIESYSQTPDYWIEEAAKTSNSGAPFFDVLKIKLHRELGYSDEKILKSPLNFIVLDYFTYLDSTGSIRLLSDRDRALIDLSKEEKMLKRLEETAAKHEAGTRK